MKNVKTIIKEYLEINGYDGLYSEECGCEINDLFPCLDSGDQCCPGYYQNHKVGGVYEECDGVTCKCIGKVKQ